MEAARNWWLELGEPDYATCGQLFCCLPQELRNQFNRSQEHTFLWVFFMAWVKGYRAGRATNYAQVAQGWIGEQIGRSRWTVARAVEQLVELGLLATKRLRPLKDGTMQSNIYLLSTKLLALLPLRLFRKRQKSPCSTSAPQEPGRGNIKRETTPPLRESSSPGKKREKDYVHEDPITHELTLRRRTQAS